MITHFFYNVFYTVADKSTRKALILSKVIERKYQNIRHHITLWKSLKQSKYLYVMPYINSLIKCLSIIYTSCRWRCFQFPFGGISRDGRAARYLIEFVSQWVGRCINPCHRSIHLYLITNELANTIHQRPGRKWIVYKR